MQTHTEEIALLLRGERHALSRQEEKEVLRHRISYFANDLVVPTWNAALVYDTAASVDVALEILELRILNCCNSVITTICWMPSSPDLLAGAGAAMVRGDRRPSVHASRQPPARVFIDVNELTDRTENALKIVGDIYAARLFTLVAARLGLDRWKASVEHKLQTLDDIYGFAVEQTAMWRGQFLELTIVLILILELALFFLAS